MKTSIKFSFLFVLLCTIATPQEAEKDYTDAFNLVEVWLEAQKDFDQLPGISAAVINDQDLLWSGGFGLSNVRKKVPSEPSTLCSICSISKLFTAVAIMKLYDEGKLRLDDRVSDLLPAYTLEQQYPESGPVTVRSLLTHTSGLPREADYPYWTGPDFPFPTRNQIDARLSDQETLYPSSTYFQYSNLGLTLLGEIVEEVSGMPFDEYIHENILEPLGLNDTRTELPEALYGKQLAIGYSALTRNSERKKVQFFQARGITPAAGFSSNVLDLGKFAAWQFRLRESKSAEILKPSTLKYMQTVHWTDPDWDITWGLGFAVWKGKSGNTWASHGGNCPGYRSILRLDLNSKRALAVMINANGTSPGTYADGINSILNEVKMPAKEESPDSGVAVINLQDYAGFYDPMPWWGEDYVGVWYGKLVMLGLPAKNPGKSMTYYKHVEGDTFRRVRDDGELGETLIFERDKKSHVTRFITHGNYEPKIKR